MAQPKDLDEAFERYNSGKGLSRNDMFKYMVAAIKELQQRIGAVDEAAVGAIDQRVGALETTIGQALQRTAPKKKEAA